MRTSKFGYQEGGVGFGVLAVVLMVMGMVGWLMYYQARVTGEKTVEVVEEQVTIEATTGAEVAGIMELSGIDNPVLRLEVFKAYAGKVRPSLSAELQERLDEVVSYVEENLTVLMTANPELSEDITEAAAAVKEALVEEETEGIAGVQMKLSEAEELEVGSEVEVSGVLVFASEDPVTGAGVFTMETSEGMTLYFVFSPANSAVYQEEMEGKMVQMTLEITAIEDDVVLYDVVAGPEIAVSPSPTEVPEEDAE